MNGWPIRCARRLKPRASRPCNEIAAYAKKAGLDMLVLGSRGQNTLMTTVLGSTASRTASQADVPLLVIRKPLKKEVGAS